MNTALFTSMTLDRGVFVEDVKLVGVGCHFEIRDWDDGDDGEEGASWFPALRAATGVVVEDIARNSDFYLLCLLWAVTVQFSTGEVRVAFCDAVVDQGMERGCHGVLYCTSTCI